MKRRSAPLDDLHQELLLWLDDLDRPWARCLRGAINGLYRMHCSMLLSVIQLCCKHGRRKFA
jgi:hypothetical protein